MPNLVHKKGMVTSCNYSTLSFTPSCYSMKLLSHLYKSKIICHSMNKFKYILLELTHILETSRNPDELKHVWLEWRNAVGPKCRNLYNEYVNLSNEAASLNNFSDTSEYWLYDYEDSNFKEQIQSLWEQLKPLYLQIHAYIRFKLRQKYGDIVSERGPIPVHLLGE